MKGTLQLFRTRWQFGAIKAGLPIYPIKGYLLTLPIVVAARVLGQP